MITIIAFVLVLGLLVLVHEWGHFITARKSGMKVYEFGFGFPPRAFGVYKDPSTGKWVWVWRKKAASREQESNLSNIVGGEEKQEEFPATLYSFNWLPLGGFVKIKGENGEDRAEKDSFGYHPYWRKALVLVAGVTMNFLLAAVLLGFGFMIGLPADSSVIEDKHAIIVEQPLVTVQEVVEGSPADVAGMKFRDQVLKINEEEIIDSSQMIDYVSKHPDQEMNVVVSRLGEMQTVVLTPGAIEGADGPRLGVILADAGVVRYPWHIAILKGFQFAATATVSIVIGFYLLLKGLILGQGLSFAVAGPVGIAVIVGESARLGISHLINITAMLSLSLAVINILPIPALDGGRLLFITIERVFGKRVPLRYEQMAHTIGFIALMALIVVVTWRDIVKLF